MPTKNDNDKGERRPSSGGTQSQGQRQNQGYTYGRSLDRDLPYEVEKVVDQLDDMIFGGLRKPTRQCDDKEPRPSDDGTLTYAAELMKDRLKKTFVQQFVHIDGSPIDSLSDDVTNDILPDETFDAGGSISEKVDLSKRRGTSARTLPRVMSPLSQPRRMIGKPLATRMLKRLSRTSFVDNDAGATAAATISHTSMENRPALIVEAVDYNENVANVNDEHVMIVEQVDYGIEKRSVFNRQIKRTTVAKVEVDDNYNKKNEATTTGPKIQPQSAASCDSRDDDKDELGATSTLEEDSNYAEKDSNTTEDVEMDAGGNIVVRDEPSASPTKRYEGVEESISDSKKEKGKKKRRAVCLLVTACMIIILIIILGSTQKRNSEQKAADFSGGEPRTLPVPPTSLSSSVPTFKPSTAPVVGASVSVQPTPLSTTDKPVSASPTASTEDEVVDEKIENIENRPADEESAGAITFDANQPSGEDDVPTLTDESGFVQDVIGNAPVATPSGVPMTARPTALVDNTVPTQGPSISPVSRSPTKSPSASPVSGSPTAAPVSDPLTASPVSDPPTAAPVGATPNTIDNEDAFQAAIDAANTAVDQDYVPESFDDDFVVPESGIIFGGVGKNVVAVIKPNTTLPVTPEPSSAPMSDSATASLVSDLPTAAPGTSKPSPGPTSAPVTNGEDALEESTDDVSDGSTTDTNIGIADGDATEEKAKKDKKSEKAEKTEMIENKGEEKVDKKEKKKGEKSEKEEDGDGINTKAETSATKDPSPEPSLAPVSDPPTASPVSDPPTAAPVTPEPSSAPVSDLPTASPVSDPPTAVPTPFPSTSPSSNPTSLPTPLPIVWEESSPGHLVTNNNRDKATDGIMLAVTAKASTITITSIDILLDSIDTNVPVEVMITQGSYFGYELYSQIWDTVGSYTIPQGNGHSRVTTIQGLDPITIASGKTIGLYILFPEGHEMLIGSAGEITSDGDIRIYSGSSVPAKFMSVERGVGWSGAIKYDV